MECCFLTFMLKWQSQVIFKEKKAKDFFSTLVEFYEISHISMSYGDLVYDRKGKL